MCWTDSENRPFVEQAIDRVRRINGRHLFSTPTGCYFAVNVRGARLSIYDYDPAEIPSPVAVALTEPA